MDKPNIKKAKKHLIVLREMVSKKENRFLNTSEEEVVKAIRKSREELWEKKFAVRS